MKKVVQWAILALILVVTVFTIYSGLDSGSESVEKDAAKAPKVQEYPEIGYLAPAFQLKSLDGEEHELKQYIGKPVILNFWASWCTPCIQEAPYFVEMHSKYKQDVQILTINLTAVDSLEGAKAFVEQFGYEFPTLLDEENEAATSYRIKPIPTTFFINPQGLITDGVYGGMTIEDLEARTKQLIQESQSSS